MPCYHPLRLESSVKAALVVSCGQCHGCLLERSRQWAVRCMHEASLHDENCSLTLTYDAQHLSSMSLDYSDFQKFMRRFRKSTGRKVRFFMCGEYGKRYSRPHFHACVFGFNFPDRVYCRKSPAGFDLFRSDVLSQLWGHGDALIGDLTFESAAYAARYCMKKAINNQDKDVVDIINVDTGEIFFRKAEFCQMSRKPGIGSDWLRLYWPEVVREGKCLSRGVMASAPKYYRRRLRDLADYADVVEAERLKGLERLGDMTPDRLRVREEVAIATISKLKRSI